MSNHDGSYMLNHALMLLHQYGFFEKLDSSKIEEFSDKILRIGWSYDVNAGEIFKGLGGKIEFCYICEKTSKEFEHDICKKCRDELWPGGGKKNRYGVVT